MNVLFLSCLGLLFATTGVAAAEMTIGFRPVPPYVVQNPDTGALSGLEYDIVTSALAVKGYQVKPQIMPLARLVDAFQARILDGAATLLPATVGTGTLSDSYLTYHNVVLALRETRLVLKKVSDLQGLSLAAFQTARKVLGPEFAQVAASSPDYVEEAQQILQIRMLFSGRVQAVVGDSRILETYLHAPETGVDTSRPVQEFPLFPPTNYGVGFRNPQVAADFNAGLAAIKANGTYTRILDRYAP